MIDHRPRRAIYELFEKIILGSNKEPEGSLGYESKTTNVFNNLQDAGGPRKAL
jgi:hypothetical protein